MHRRLNWNGIEETAMLILLGSFLYEYIDIGRNSLRKIIHVVLFRGYVDTMLNALMLTISIYVLFICMYLYRYQFKLNKKQIVSMVFVAVCSIGLLCSHGTPYIFPRILLKLFFCAQLYDLGNEIINMMKTSDEAILLEKKMLQSRIDIMMAQIRPHFIYNVLVSIKQLCLVNPGKAKEEINRLTVFLNDNFQSFSEKNMISLETETNHIKRYLELEKLRFGERLQYEFSLEAKEFNIPPLTIQPIVENAVRHGVTKKSSGGKVEIITKEEKSYYLILVKDNGVGYQEKENIARERAHIGIENVKERLKIQCNATVTAKSVPGIGTTVTVKIPKEIKMKEFL